MFRFLSLFFLCVFNFFFCLLNFCSWMVYMVFFVCFAYYWESYLRFFTVLKEKERNLGT